MGLILGDEAKGEAPVVLTDILGSEDALGDMDFKIAGDAEGLTAFQLDIKVEGITLPVMRTALESDLAVVERACAQAVGAGGTPGGELAPFFDPMRGAEQNAERAANATGFHIGTPIAHALMVGAVGQVREQEPSP